MENTNKNDFNATIGNIVLCDGFLIPMTDFVNNVGNMENYPSHEKALSLIYNYSTFLNQPLKLEMFVPCDEYDNVLETPKEPNIFWNDDEQDSQIWAEYQYILDKYKQVKEKVLFEGFDVYDYKLQTFFYQQNKKKLSYDKKAQRFVTIENLLKNVEDLLLINFQFKITQSALNAIFGKTVA